LTVFRHCRLRTSQPPIAQTSNSEADGAKAQSPISCIEVSINQNPRSSPMPEAVQNQCAHPRCTCPVAEGEKYCSQACSDAAESSSGNDRCTCPHPKCTSAMAA